MANTAVVLGSANEPGPGDLAAAAAVRRRLRQALLLMNRSLASNELSALQYHLLLEVAVAGGAGINQVSLAELLAVPEGRISFLVQELKNRALVTQTKSARNRRIATIHLTSKGRRVLAKAMEAQRRVLAKMVTGIPQDELASMVEWGVREYLQLPEPHPSYDWR